MSTNTTNYNLVKPDYNDTADIADINGNMDILDEQLKAVSDVANAASPSWNGGQLNTNYDFNDLRTLGNKTYFANFSLGANSPISSGYGYVENILANTIIVMQRVTVFSNGTVYVRFYANNQWYPWVKIAQAIT